MSLSTREKGAAMSAQAETTKHDKREERDVLQAMEFEQTFEGADEADALYLMSLYENTYNDMTLSGVKSRVKE